MLCLFLEGAKLERENLYYYICELLRALWLVYLVVRILNGMDRLTWWCTSKLDSICKRSNKHLTTLVFSVPVLYGTTPSFFTALVIRTRAIN